MRPDATCNSSILGLATDEKSTPCSGSKQDGMDLGPPPGKLEGKRPCSAQKFQCNYFLFVYDLFSVLCTTQKGTTFEPPDRAAPNILELPVADSAALLKSHHLSALKAWLIGLHRASHGFYRCKIFSIASKALNSKELNVCYAAGTPGTSETLPSYPRSIFDRPQ